MAAVFEAKTRGVWNTYWRHSKTRVARREERPWSIECVRVSGARKNPGFPSLEAAPPSNVCELRPQLPGSDTTNCVAKGTRLPEPDSSKMPFACGSLLFNSHINRFWTSAFKVFISPANLLGSFAKCIKNISIPAVVATRY